jgi:hypothetical protein
MWYVGQSLVALDHRGVHLRWTPSVATDLKGYYVYMSEQDDQHFIRMTAEPVKAPEWVSPALRTDMKYFFSITAVDRTGNESGASDVVPFYFPDSTIDLNLVPVAMTQSFPIAGDSTEEELLPASNFMTSFIIGG